MFFMNLDNKIYKYLFGLYLLLIIMVSSIPGKSLPKVILFSPDKLLHILEYGIAGLLAFMSFKSFRIPIIMGILAFAILDEYWQSFIPGRMSSFYDVIADMIGFSLVMGMMYYISRKKSINQHG